MTETWIAIAIMMLLVVSLGLYFFDPWLGIAFGIAVGMMTLMFLLTSRGAHPRQKRNEMATTAWDEEDEAPHQSERTHSGRENVERSD